MRKIRYRLCHNYTGKLNLDGRAPVTLECRQGASRIYMSSNVMIYPYQWNHGSIINHDNANKLTVYLTKWMHSIEEIELDAILNGHPLTLSQLKSAVKSGTKASATLEEFVEAVIDTSTRSNQTKAAYHTLAREAEKYDKSITVNSIDHDWIERWRSYMHQAGLSDNTIKGRLKQLHCLTQEAIKRDLISSDPFKWITIGNMTPRKEYLTMSEIKKFENAKLDGKEAVVRDFCLLAAYTGLRYSDISTLEEADIKDGILRKRMYKTKREVTIPIGTLFYGKGQEIINRYNPITKLSHCVGANSTVNKIIKDISQKIGINKPVHCHIFRKSCSSLLYQLGMPLSEISMVLGHSKIETTSKYYVFGKEKSLIKSSKRLFKKNNK